jgi:hypothetical protein
MKLVLVIVGIMILMSGTFSSMFSNAFASTPSDVFIVSSDSGAEVKTMELRAVKENGEVRRVSAFDISIENVVTIALNGKVTVFSEPVSPEFTSAKLTDTTDRTVEIPITESGVISLAGFREGIYTLDVIVDDRFAFECIVVIGPEEEQNINREITEVNKRTVEHYKKILVPRGINKARICLFTPSHPICKPDENGNCPKGWAMNEDGQCYPRYLKCPPGYWRADDDETGACVPLPQIPFLPLSFNGTPGSNVTDGIGNATDIDTTPQPNATDTDTTPPDTPPVNITDGSDGGGGRPNATEPAEFGPPIECPEGEQLSSDGLSCVPIVTEEPIPVECPEGEQPTADGFGCEPIMAEEPTPIECGEGEELIDGECQAIPTEEETALEEEPEEEIIPEEEPEQEEPEEEEPEDEDQEGNNP